MNKGIDILSVKEKHNAELIITKYFPVAFSIDYFEN